MGPATLRLRQRLIFACCLVLTALVTSGANCEDRPPRAPFLCCVLSCSGGLVQAGKEVPERMDTGWVCKRGSPIDYEASCSAEDTLECEDDTMQNTSGGPAMDAGNGV